MSQHARPVGPTTTNTAATFTPSMVQGSAPPAQLNQRVAHLGPRPVGWHAAQTTHVQASFGPEMAQGQKPEKNREFLPLRTGRTWWTPEVPQFDSAMTQGWHPDSPRIVLGPKLPQTATQHAHITAFSLEMALGSKPDRFRQSFPLPIGWSVSQLTHVIANVTPDMVTGWKPDTRARQDLRVNLGTIAHTPDVPAFSIEMVRGWLPGSPRILLGPRIGLPQWPITPVTTFSAEMVAGQHPDLPRLFLAPRIPLNIAQHTHASAPITLDMLAGWKPEKKAYGDLRLKTGWFGQAIDIPAFSIEMVRGARPDRPVIMLAPRIPLPWAQTTHVQAAFSTDMARGQGVDRNRERLAPRAPYSTIPPDVSLFSIEMVQGSHPDAPRFVLRRQGSDIALSPDVPGFSIEMFQGARPDSPRLFIAPKAGHLSIPITHDEAPFSHEMVTGSRPDLPRTFLHPNPRLFRCHWGDELKTLAFVIADTVLDLSASYITALDLGASALVVLDADGSIITILDLDASEDD